LEKKLTKEELKSPDLFIKEAKTVFHYIEEHAKLLGFVTAVLFITGISYAIYDFVKDKTEKTAQVSLFEARKKKDDILRDLQKEADKKKEASDKAAGKKKGEKQAEQPVEEAPFNQEVVAAYQSVVSKHPKSRAAAVAAIELSDYYLIYDKKSEALEALSKVTSTDDFHAGLLRLQKGRALEANGKCQEAIAEWSGVVSNKNLVYWYGDVLLKLAICYEQLKDTQNAKATYDRIVTEFADSSAAAQAKKYKRLLERRS
jgi:lipopolysaccharide biosynthesis regulator YciM